MQGLLDPSDASLDFVMKRGNVRPIAIYRIEEDFLLCYDGMSSSTGAAHGLTIRICILRQQEWMEDETEVGYYMGGSSYCFRCVMALITHEKRLTGSTAISLRDRVRTDLH